MLCQKCDARSILPSLNVDVWPTTSSRSERHSWRHWTGSIRRERRLRRRRPPSSSIVNDTPLRTCVSSCSSPAWSTKKRAKNVPTSFWRETQTSNNLWRTMSRYGVTTTRRRWLLKKSKETENAKFNHFISPHTR